MIEIPLWLLGFLLINTFVLLIIATTNMVNEN